MQSVDVVPAKVSRSFASFRRRAVTSICLAKDHRVASASVKARVVVKVAGSKSATLMATHAAMPM
jgi:hypothetical protein